MKIKKQIIKFWKKKDKQFSKLTGKQCFFLGMFNGLLGMFISSLILNISGFDNKYFFFLSSLIFAIILQYKNIDLYVKFLKQKVKW